MRATDRAALQILRQATNDIWPGAYRGRVESIDDPDRLGRAKVRVFAVHGSDDHTPDSALPWADISEHGGGGYDYGAYNPPPVGSSIWVVFECGRREYPVVFGTYRGVPKRDADNPQVLLTKDGKPVTEKPWLPPDEGLETPKDVFEDVFGGDSHPTRRVWQKSYKGHTFVVEDGDGKEFLKIIDRAGQVIEMSCPVDTTTQAGNKAQRGVRDAMRGDQLPHSIMRDRRASIRIRDLSGQEIVLDATDQAERVVIRSRSRLGGGENKITLGSGKGRNRIELEDNGGDIIRLDPESSTPILLRDSSGNAIIFDREQGKIRFITQKASEEDVPRKSTVVRGEKESQISGSEIKTIRGNKKTQVVGDTGQGVLGNSAVSIGGALKALIANTSPGGPELTALDLVVGGATSPLANIQVATDGIAGGIKFKIGSMLSPAPTVGDFVVEIVKTGNLKLTTALGNVDLGTVAGNCLLGTNAGNVTVQTSAGIAKLATLAGKANVDGNLGVHLGAMAASIHPLVRGTPFAAEMTAFLAALNAHTVALGAIVAALLPLAGVTPVQQSVVAAATSVLVAAAASLSGKLIPGAILSLKSFTE